MVSFQPLGLVCKTEDGRIIYVPIESQEIEQPVATIERPGQGGVVKVPTPEQDRIDKEEAVDVSLVGVIKKNTNPE